MFHTLSTVIMEIQYISLPKCRVYFFFIWWCTCLYSYIRGLNIPLLQHYRTELVATEKELYVTEQVTCMSPYSKCQKFSDVYK